MEHETQKRCRELLEKWMLSWEAQKEKLNPSDNADSQNNLTEKGNIATFILEKMKELEPKLYIPNGIGSLSTDGSAGFTPEG
jgi:hypothetical protein